MYHVGKKLVVILLLIGGSLIAQTQKQAKDFINISMKGVYKVQKEILRGNLTTSEAEFKKCVKYQFIAVKLYDQNKFFEAVGYSLKARVLAVEILDPIDKIAREKMKVTDDEKTFCDPAKYSNLKLDPNLLSASETKKIDELNSSSYPEFRTLKLGVPIE